MATEEDLAPVRSRLLGMIDESRIAKVRIPRPEPGVVARYLAIFDLASTVSDALDEEGVGGSIAASTLGPLSPGQRVCGPAITARYVPVGGSPGAHYARSSRPLLADRDLYQLGEVGDVAVFDCGGRADVSVVGGMSAAWAKQVGIAACVIDGGMRDVAAIRGLGNAIWSRGRTPTTGRHRMEAVELNGIAHIAGVQVVPGDLIVADDSGVCVVPAAHILAVLDRCEISERAEARALSLISEGRNAREIAAVLPFEQW
jgi:4-hydroxy-4-methyl-2-oxoglutarate aldolase